MGQFQPQRSYKKGDYKKKSVLESVSSEKNSWMGFSRRLSKSSNYEYNI